MNKLEGHSNSSNPILRPGCLFLTEQATRAKYFALLFATN